MKLTSKMLKKIILEEMEALKEAHYQDPTPTMSVVEADFPSPAVKGKLDAESGVPYNFLEYTDRGMQNYYHAGYLEAMRAEIEPQKDQKPEAKIEPQKDQEAAGMPMPSDFEMSGGGGQSSGPAMKKLRPDSAFTKKMMRRRK